MTLESDLLGQEWLVSQCAVCESEHPGTCAVESASNNKVLLQKISLSPFFLLLQRLSVLFLSLPVDICNNKNFKPRCLNKDVKKTYKGKKNFIDINMTFFNLGSMRKSVFYP